MERLDQVVVGTGPEAPDPLLDLTLGGEHDDRDVGGGLLLADLRRDLVAVELGQHDVEEDERGSSVLHSLKPSAPSLATRTS